MSLCTAVFLDRDHEPTAGIFPEKYFRCSAVTDFHFIAPVWDRQMTEVRVAWSAKFLYLHFWALDNLILARETRPKGPVEFDDSLGVYISPEPSTYFGWEANALSTLSELRVRPSGVQVVETDLDTSWKTAAVIKANRYPSGWALELKIPFEKDLMVKPRSGQKWKISFHRHDFDMQGRCTKSSWTVPHEATLGFHSPQTFGELIFA